MKWGYENTVDIVRSPITLDIKERRKMYALRSSGVDTMGGRER